MHPSVTLSYYHFDNHGIFAEVKLCRVMQKCYTAMLFKNKITYLASQRPFSSDLNIILTINYFEKTLLTNENKVISVPILQ